MLRIRAAFATLLVLASPVIAVASPDMDKTLACIQSASTTQPPESCIAEALSPCLTMPADTPALASVCFREADTAFSLTIRNEMQRLSDTAPERIAAIAGVEVKYDLLMGLAQCDRLKELALIGEAEVSAIQLEDDRCRSVASGMTLLRLILRSSDL